mmetsp:Transcript_13293/g.22563  ORF Transcript_13293/g.22563 Transcript_13293/m.22563 type:complete len:107 (+) Transcript_13293:51-371(+)
MTSKGYFKQNTTNQESSQNAGSKPSFNFNAGAQEFKPGTAAAKPTADSKTAKFNLQAAEFKFEFDPKPSATAPSNMMNMPAPPQQGFVPQTPFYQYPQQNTGFIPS